MPNWVRNTVEVEGKRANEVCELFRSCKEPFDSVCPMPKEQEENWYDWRCENWGTKWEPRVNFVEGNIIRFETAWATPAAILMKITLKYEVVLKVSYFHELFGNGYGNYKVENGEVKDFEHFDYNYEELGI